MDFDAWTAKDSEQFLLLIARKMKIPTTQIVAKYRSGSVIADLRLRKDVSTPDKLTQLHAAIDVIQTTSPQYRITSNVIIETHGPDEEEATPTPPEINNAMEAPRAPRVNGVGKEITENNVVIYGSVLFVCMVLAAIGVCIYCKRNPPSVRGTIKNFQLPEKVSRGPIPHGRVLRRMFPRVVVAEDDMPDLDNPEDEELQEVVTDTVTTDNEAGSTPQAASPPTMTPIVICRRPSSANLPGFITETEEIAIVLTPQRPRTESPRHALWHSGVKGGSAENSAHTVTTERLGTISRSSQSGGLAVEHHYPQRSRYDSVFDATNTEPESQIFDFSGDDVGGVFDATNTEPESQIAASEAHSAPPESSVGVLQRRRSSPTSNFATQDIDWSDLL